LLSIFLPCNNNLARTDGILDSGVPIDSAIVGMTAMVFVNNSAITIELGHQGFPVDDVILRIYRQIERDLDRSVREIQSEEREGEENIFSFVERKEQGHHYETRINLDDDCDESISCSYYEGKGILSSAGCETVDVTDEYVDCACDHYSNFGLLFNSCDSDEWTIYRILTIAFLASAWALLAIFFLLATYSKRFKMFFGLETLVEKNRRVLGELPDQKPGAIKEFFSRKSRR